MERNEYEMMYKKHFVKNKDFELGVCCLDEDYMQVSDEYKQVFSCAETYLKQKNVQHQKPGDSNYFVFHNFNVFVKRNRDQHIKNTWGGLASVFLLLTWYALRVLRAPWRKSYHRIKTYSGHFQHEIYGNFPHAVAIELMERLGYIYHDKQQTFLFQQQSLTTGSWKDALTRAGMDFFLVHVRCSLTSTQTGRSIEVESILDTSEGEDTLLYAPQSLKQSPLNNSETDLAATKPAISSVHETLSKRHSSPAVPKKSAYVRNQLLGETTVPLNSATSKRPSRPPSADWQRAGAVPNQYVSNKVMRKVTLGRKHSLEGGESSRAAIPWEHRFTSSAIPSSTQCSSRRRADDYSNYVPQFTEDNEDLTLYEGKDSIEQSVIDSAIRYPPQDSYPAAGARDNNRPRRSPTGGDITNPMNTLKVGSTSGWPRKSTLGHDNYVSVKPIPRSKIAHPPRDRVESGYYSEWQSTRSDPIYRSPEVVSMDTVAHQAYKRPGRGQRFNDPSSNVKGGEYVHVFPPKRPPGDGRSEAPRGHIYQEIPEGQWSTTPRLASNSSKTRLNKSSNTLRK
ncbi:unnamed protein product [Clavelina lepadiformis]|uniref:Uncharacterized protein n=1 Tax=Clavelina lepadiformis TaxID=159417 RepID=A0ABP0FE91_CLALP